MNITQKIAALFGAQYILQVWKDSAYVMRVVKVGNHWIAANGGTRIYPQGKFPGFGASWEPLTSKIKSFYDLEDV